MIQKLLFALAATAAILAAQAPTFSGVVNAASGIPPGFPNSGLAQGSVFTAYGSNLGASPAPPGIVNLATLPLPTTAGLAGTIVTITVGDSTVTAPMLFTSSGQVAGIIPSTTPVGPGTLTLTYNGNSGSTSITVVQSAFGISNIALAFTDNGVGSGQAVVASFGTKQTQIVTNTDTAAPGDTLILWGTGLGATTANGDTAGAPFGNIGSAPVVFVGGVQSPSVTYWGRSPGSVGLDQIVFTVPQNAPLGCNVGIVVQTMDGITPVVSNGPTIALASTDGTICSDPAQRFPSALIESMNSVNGFYLSLQQNVFISPNPTGVTTSTTSQAHAFFAQFTPAQLEANAVSFNAANYVPTFGSCYTGFSNNPSANGPALSSTPLNEGSSITLTPLSGKALTLNSQGAGAYQSPVGTTALSSGTWSYSSPGSSGVAPLAFSFPVPQQVTWSNEKVAYSSPIDRTSPFMITWTGGDANGYVDIQGSAQNATGTVAGIWYVGFECAVPTSARQFTIPSSILLAMPAGASVFASIQVSTYSFSSILGTVSGFNFPLEISQFQTSVPVIFE